MSVIKQCSFRFVLTVLELSKPKFDDGFTSAQARLLHDNRYILSTLKKMGWAEVAKEGKSRQRKHTFTQEGYLQITKMEKLLNEAMGETQ